MDLIGLITQCINLVLTVVIIVALVALFVRAYKALGIYIREHTDKK